MTSKYFDVAGNRCTFSEKNELLVEVKLDTVIGSMQAWQKAPQRLVDEYFGAKEDREEEKLLFGDLKKIPFVTMLFIREYFAAVYAKHKSEAIVLFHWDNEKEDYVIIVPPSSNASGAHVTYEANVMSYCEDCRIGNPDIEPESCPFCDGTDMKSAAIVGTAHSHGSMSAFHSGTDDENELNHTGFHITFGYLDRDVFAVKPSFVLAVPGFTDAKGQGERYLPEVSTIVEDPFVEVRTRIETWSNLVVSAPASMKIANSDYVLMNTAKKLYIIGLPKDRLTTIADQFNKVAGVTGEGGLQVVLKSEFLKLSAQSTQKTYSKGGSTPSTAGAGTTPASPTAPVGAASATGKTNPGSTPTTTTVVGQTTSKSRTTMPVTTSGNLPFKPPLFKTDLGSFVLRSGGVVDVDTSGVLRRRVETGSKTLVYSGWYPAFGDRKVIGSHYSTMGRAYMMDVVNVLSEQMDLHLPAVFEDGADIVKAFQKEFFDLIGDTLTPIEDFSMDEISITCKIGNTTAARSARKTINELCEELAFDSRVSADINQQYGANDGPALSVLWYLQELIKTQGVLKIISQQTAEELLETVSTFALGLYVGILPEDWGSEVTKCTTTS